LLLPNGAVEGQLAMRVDTTKYDGRYTVGGLLPSIRVGLGAAEIEAGASLYLFDDFNDDPDGSVSGYPEPDRLQNVYAIGRFTVAPETIVAAQFIAGTPTNDDYKTYVPGAFVEHKEHLSKVSSLNLTGGLNYVHPSVAGDAPVQSSLDFYGKISGALQVAPLVALEGRAEYHLVKQTGDMVYVDHYTSNLFAVGLVGSVAPDFDVVAAVEIDSTAQIDTKAFIVGIVGRRIP
jgi:hypothetical protein